MPLRVTDSVLAEIYRLMQAGTLNYANDSGAVNAYVLDMDPAPSAYYTGMPLRFKAATTNTGPATINVIGLAGTPLGTLAIRKNAGSVAATGLPLVANDIMAGQLVEGFHDGTYFQIRTNDFLSAPGIVSTDAAMGGGTPSDLLVPSQKAAKTYIDALLEASDALAYKGVKDCSANPNYPAANAGHTYRVSVAGKIGGGSGISVGVGDLLLCMVDSSVSGTQAAVGANWNIIPSYSANLAALAALASIANLSALAGLTGAASNVPYFTGAGTMGLLAIGTAANELLQVGSDGKLPVIDGSKLTGIVTNPGEGRLIFLPQDYSGITQGTWVPYVDNTLYYGQYIYNTSEATGDRIDWKAYLAAGTYTLVLVYGTGANGGIVKCMIDGTEVGTTIDQYTAAPSANNIAPITGITVATSGLKTVSLISNTKNASSGAYRVLFYIFSMYRTA